MSGRAPWESLAPSGRSTMSSTASGDDPTPSVRREHRWTLGRLWSTALAAAGLGYAVVASFTRPFTLGADVVTAIPLVAAAALTVWTIRSDGSDVTDRRSPAAAPLGPISRWWTVWLAPIVAATAWELYCLAHLPRIEHPTVSALIDSLDSTRVGKIVAVAAWLALGWFLVSR